MVNAALVCEEIINLLNKNKINYRLFKHKPAFNYKDLLEAQKQTGFFGTEMKCLVLKSENFFLVYVTIQGNKIDFNKVKKFLEINELRLATPEELKEILDAEPGCAYPFGFNREISIFIDPAIYNQEWLLFSPALPDKTIQIKAPDLKKVFSSLENTITEVNFNQ